MTTLTLEHFMTHIGTSFPLADHPPAGLVLTTAAAIPAGSGSNDGRTAFALTFQSTDTRNWGQDLYRIGHPVLGVIEVFMVPVAGDRHGVTYEAVFN